MFTESKSLFGIITKCGSTTEQRLFIELHLFIEAYENSEVSEIGLVWSENNVADAFINMRSKDT